MAQGLRDDYCAISGRRTTHLTGTKRCHSRYTADKWGFQRYIGQSQIGAGGPARLKASTIVPPKGVAIEIFHSDSTHAIMGLDVARATQLPQLRSVTVSIATKVEVLATCGSEEIFSPSTKR
jgi:hypothetical protein